MKQAIEFKLKRSRMSPDKREELNSHFFAQSDLYGYCKCGKRISGTIEELKKPCSHKEVV